ncbi:Uncharacterised protein [uncultured archaeon]|nr:Uncharacterised protein [uncultured archaeon]
MIRVLNKKFLFLFLFFLGFVIADSVLNGTNLTNDSLTNNSLTNSSVSSSVLSITDDQPLCKIYSLIKTLGSIVAIIMLAYAGFQLIASTDMLDRSNAKNILAGAIIGLIIIWLAPLLVKFLTGSTDVCGF